MDRRSGSSLISDSFSRIADIWEADVESRGEGDAAWSWIKASDHWRVIKAAEDELDRIGRNGDPDELNAVCGNWVAAWVQAIRGFYKAPGGENRNIKSQTAFHFSDNQAGEG
jgi:hypothetical protein